MDNKSAVLIVVALMIGLVAGFLINSLVNQSQLQQLHDDAANYQSQINSLTAIIAKWSSSGGTPNPSSTATPVPTGTPSPENSTSVYTPDLQVYDTNAGQDGAYYYVNFSVYNIGTGEANITWVYLNAISNQALAGLSSMTVNGQSVPSGEQLNLILQPGATATFVLEGSAGAATGTIWQDSMAISISVQTSDGEIFSAGSQAILP